jgi:hypothetical protein
VVALRTLGRSASHELYMPSPTPQLLALGVVLILHDGCLTGWLLLDCLVGGGRPSTSHSERRRRWCHDASTQYIP